MTYLWILIVLVNPLPPAAPNPAGVALGSYASLAACTAAKPIALAQIKAANPDKAVSATCSKQTAPGK